MKTKISNLALINVEELNKRIEELMFDDTSDREEYNQNLREKRVLKTIKQSLIPAIKLAEQAFEAGSISYANSNNKEYPLTFQQDKEEFLKEEIEL